MVGFDGGFEVYWSMFMIEQIIDLFVGVFGFCVCGQVIVVDYENVLVFDVEVVFVFNFKLCLFYYCGDDFIGFDVWVVWDDVKFGLCYFSGWECVVLVIDVGWLCLVVWIMGFVIFGEFCLFGNVQLDEVK